MKKVRIIVIAILLLIFSTAVFAQKITAKGIKAGLNIATITGDDAENLDSKMGFVFGGFLSFESNETFSFQPEILFTRKGAKSENEYIDDDDRDYEEYEKEEVSWNLNYLEIPLLAKLKIPTKGKIKPNLFFGPALSFCFSAKWHVDWEYKEYEDGILVYEEKGSYNGDINAMNDVDIGIVFGAGIDIGMITVDARYTIGLAPIFDEEEMEGSAKANNSVFSIMLGYTLP